jgi:hypothetical protein
VQAQREKDTVRNRDHIVPISRGEQVRAVKVSVAGVIVSSELAVLAASLSPLIMPVSKPSLRASIVEAGWAPTVLTGNVRLAMTHGEVQLEIGACLAVDVGVGSAQIDVDVECCLRSSPPLGASNQDRAEAGESEGALEKPPPATSIEGVLTRAGRGRRAAVEVFSVRSAFCGIVTLRPRTAGLSAGVVNVGAGELRERLSADFSTFDGVVT